MKKSIIPVAAFIAGMAIVPSVFAADNNPTHEYDNWAELANNCLYVAKDGTTCKLTKDAEYTGSHSTVTNNVTLDLGGHTVTAKDTDNAFIVVNGGLTVVNGHIKNENNNQVTVKVAEGASLVLADTADIKGHAPVVGENAESITINGAVETDKDAAAISINATGDETAVAISGSVISKGTASAYEQTGKVATTVKGKLSAKTAVAMKISGGSLVLTGATVTSDNSAIEFTGNVETATINGCSQIASNKEGAALWFDGGIKMETLTIVDSTLKSAKGHTLDGGPSSAVETVKIADSKLIAGTDKEVKGGDIEFDEAEYDGRVLDDEENVLSTAKGSYGTLAAACGGSAAAEEGEEESKEDGVENPNTADTIATYMTIAAVALLGLGATAFVAKKSNR